MPDRKAQKLLVLAKLEGTYATDPSPVATADAILTKNAAFQDWLGETEERGTDRPELGNEIEYHTSVHSQITFQVEFCGHGSAADGVPAWSVLLKCCGVLETVNAAVSVVYSPRDSGYESATLYFHLDGKLYKMIGCRGNVRLVLNPGRNPAFEFTIMGLRANPTDVPIPTNEDFTAFQIPVAVNNANSSFTMAGLAAPDMIMAGLELDFGNQVIHRDVVGQDAIKVTDRRPTGTVTIEDPLVATYDFDAAVAAHTLVAAAFIHQAGTAGKTLTVDMPKIQLLRPTLQDLQGQVGTQFQLKLIPDSGLDELTITQT